MNAVENWETPYISSKSFGVKVGFSRGAFTEIDLIKFCELYIMCDIV